MDNVILIKRKQGTLLLYILIRSALLFNVISFSLLYFNKPINYYIINVIIFSLTQKYIYIDIYDIPSHSIIILYILNTTIKRKR